MGRRAWSVVLFVVGLVACAGEPDLQVTAAGAAGDGRLEAAARALSSMPRPWTVPSLAAAVRSERDPARRAHLLTVLATSRDPRAGVRLGEALDDPSLDVRAAAAWGLARYFVEAVPVGGTEQAMDAARGYWKAHEGELRRGAGETK